MAKYTAGYLYCGSGLNALGSDAAEFNHRGEEHTFVNVGGVDNDKDCCADFRNLTGAPALCADIGHMRPRTLREFFGPVAPQYFKWSPPCKGASQLLSKLTSETEKYQAMNRLAKKTLRKVFAAWPRREERPIFIVIENVPSFQTRCADDLKEMLRLLRRAGYEVDLRTHNLGEEGGLAQNRVRFTLAARDPKRCPVPVEMPPKRRLRGVGEVLGPLPFPDDPRAGRLGRLPRIKWLNAVRLALIPPGGDWRDLPKRGGVVEWLVKRGLWPTGVDSAPFLAMIEAELGNPVAAGQKRREVHHRHRVQGWETPAPTIAGPGGAALAAIEDRRVRDLAMGADNPRRHQNKYAVTDWSKPAGTVTGAQQVGSGGPAVADQRLLDLALEHEKRRGSFGVTGWGQPAPTVRGVSRADNGAAAIADARVGELGLDYSSRPFHHVDRVTPWDAPAGTVTASPAPSSGGGAVADPRIDGIAIGKTGDEAGRWSGRPGMMGVGDWSQPANAVTGFPRVSGGHAQAAVADPRPSLEQLGLGCAGRNGFYGVLDWQLPANAVTGSAGIDNGPFAVMDPRELPPPRPIIDIRLALQLLAEGWEVPKKTLAPAVISPISGCWHRAVTTLELAVLQGLPWWLDSGPLTLSGNSDRLWREHIGNGIPVGAALAWGRSFLEALARSRAGEGWRLCGNGQWVRPIELLEAGA